jgi:hypothetical protein
LQFEWLAPLSGAAHEQIRSIVPMVVITVASRKGGSGKSTLTAHLAAYANKASRRCLLIDADPQGSLTLWHGLRKSGEPLLRSATRGVDNLIKAAKDAGLEWVFIDTPPQMSGIVNDAIRAATLVVIPARRLSAMRARLRSPPWRAKVSTSSRRRCGPARSRTAPPIRWHLPRAKAPANSIPIPRRQLRSPACSRRSNAP